MEDSQTLTITASSSNTALIDTGEIAIVWTDGGDAAGSTQPTINVTPKADQNGSATITVTVNDGGGGTEEVSTTFNVTVNAVNDAPTVGVIADQVIDEDGSTGAISFTVDEDSAGDANEDSQTLTITASSSNTALIDTGEIAIVWTDGGDAAGSTQPTINVTPKADQNGTATITVTVNDGGGGTEEVSTTFNVIGQCGQSTFRLPTTMTLVLVPSPTVDEDRP